MITGIGLYQCFFNIASLSSIQQSIITFLGGDINVLNEIVTLSEKLTWQQEGEITLLSIFILFIFLSLATALGLPRQIAAVIAGLNFGFFIGVILATFATTLGCFLTLTIARYLLSDRIAHKYPKKTQQLTAFLAEQTFLKAIVIRILPLGSNFITNVIAGVSNLPIIPYVSGSFIGFIPQMIIFSLAGSGIHLGEQNELIITLTLLVIALLLITYLVKQHLKSQHNAL